MKEYKIIDDNDKYYTEEEINQQLIEFEEIAKLMIEQDISYEEACKLLNSKGLIN